MAQRRFRAAPLQENRYGTLYPSPTVRVVDTTMLNGGLNLWDLDYRMDTNQSPDLLNVYWKDGCLSSRRGQEYIYKNVENDPYGKAYACYDIPWHGFMVAHKGDSLYKIDFKTGEHTQLSSGLTSTVGGSFFVFGDKLYYMSGKEYLTIDEDFNVAPVEPYIPLTVVNRKPDGIGGSQNEDENRLSPKKRIQFTTDGESTAYKIPKGYTPMDAVGVKAKLTSPSEITYYEVQSYSAKSKFPTKGEADIYYKDTGANATYVWSGTEYVTATAPDASVTFTVDRTNGVITFNTAPAAAMTQTPSNLEMVVSKSDADTQNSILNCTCAIVYGGDKQLAVVCGGTPKQPNAYFWSGTSDKGLDPTYFPFDYYNYAGARTSEYITGFGKQQSMLVIFKENSIGKTYFSQTVIDNVSHLKLSYTPVNDNIGCDLPGSIKLIQNNLTFANSYAGVFVLADSTSYGENTVRRISRNVNGDRSIKGFLHDVSKVPNYTVTAYDDRQRYWVAVNGNVYLWDYTISGLNRKEENMTWFRFDKIEPQCWFTDTVDMYYLKSNGSLVYFCNRFADFGEPIMRKYKFSTLNFGTYERLKDVLKVVLAARSDTDSLMKLTYDTDYETREDETPLRLTSWSFVPRSLASRTLRIVRYAGVAVRIPRCFHVRHFSMTLENNDLDTDMSIISVQVFYRFSYNDR